jgi:hypothetical protein
MADTEEPRKGRSNAILTYETVEAVNLGIQRVELKLDALAVKVSEQGAVHADHEVRLRALELSGARQSGGLSLGASVLLAIPSVVACVLALLAYLKP